MSSSGQNTFKGINTQAKASLLLFLLNLKDRGFDSIILEDKEWEDFTLNFKSGKKTICESKDWSIALSWKDVKGILSRILKRKSKLNKTDEVIIVCRSVNQELEKGIKYLKYSAFGINDVYKKHGFTKEQTRLLARTSFFKIKSDKFLYQEALTYFADQIPYWVPVKDLEMFMDSVLIHDIYFKSERGTVFTAAELREKIEDYKKRKIKASYAYDPQRKKLEEQLKSILSGLRNPKLRALILSSDALTALTAQPNNMFFLLDQVKKQKKVNLSKMDELWQALTKRLYAFTMLRIIEENIDSSENAKYALSFITENYNVFTSPIRDTFNQEHCVDIASKIFGKHPDRVDEVFGFIEAVLKIRGKAYTRLENRRDYSRERELISKLLYKVYSCYQGTKNNSKIEEIIDLTDKHFYLIDDDSRFVMFTPDEIFWILRDYINLNFENNFPEVLELLLKQYQSSRWYKDKFAGWDRIGGGISQSGSEFSLTDRHFISLTLEQSLEKYHTESREKAWQFILKNCIARKESEVSKDRPDFLNRAVIGILVKEHTKTKYKDEAFEILGDFIKMRKGIPWKADLIFQSVRDTKLKNEEKWTLVEVSLKAYKNLPVNVFIEQITSDLAAKGHKQAILAIADWAKNPEYAKRHTIGSFDIIDNVSKLLDKPKTFDEGVEILKTHLASPDFIEKTDTFDTYDVAKAVAKIIEKKLAVGIGLLKEIDKSKTLTINQQIAVSGGLYNIPDEKKNTLLKAYREFLKPALKNLGDIKKIEKRFSHRHSRESIVQFAEKLAKAHYFDEALWLVKIFINDSNPTLENYPDDPKGDFNYHQKIIEGDDKPTINTVRGYCAWVLQKFCTRYGRDYISRILDLVEQLTKDPNYYVRVQACIPLLELVKNRHTVLVENRKERFLPMKVAERIENIAFAMLKNKENHKLKAVMKHLAMVFTYMRSLTEEEAKEVLKIFLKTKIDEVVEKIDLLFIFFAEFRRDAFKKKQAKIVFEKKWSKIKTFDDKDFKKILRAVLKSGSPNVKAHLAWRFWQLPKETGMDFDKGIKISMRYLPILTKEYSHEVFSNIYHFIKEYVDKKFNECFVLWSKCLLKERPYLRKAVKDKDNVHNVYWWPFFYNGKILLAVAKHRGNEEFLKWFKFLADYPTEVLIANDLDVAVERLAVVKKEKNRVEKLFTRLIKRNPKYYDYKQRWLKIRDKK